MKLPVANLQTQLKALGLNATQVQARLNRMGFDLSYSTVAGWLNGSRGIRDVKHMRALCEALESDLQTLSGGELELSEKPLDVAISREIKGLTDAEKEAILALTRTMRSK